MQQLDKGVLSIQVLSPVGNIVAREQDLGNGLAPVHEELVPETHEFALADGSQCLDLWEVLWPAFHVHVAESDTNGARRDDDDLVSIFLQFARRFDNCAQDGEEGLMRLFVDNGRSA